MVKMRATLQMLGTFSEREFEEIEDFCEEGGLPRTPWMQSEIHTIFVMRDSENQIVATAKLEKNGQRHFIEDLVVRADLRGKGFGKEILSAIIDEAKKKKINTVWAMARAHDLFKKSGFKPDNDRKLLEYILQYCRNCEDYLGKCNPELLRIDL